MDSSAGETNAIKNTNINSNLKPIPMRKYTYLMAISLNKALHFVSNFIFTTFHERLELQIYCTKRELTYQMRKSTQERKFGRSWGNCEVS
jgi:hypothetical protein